MRLVMSLLLFFWGIHFSMAHPGRTDKHGCHINSDNGLKHCHQPKKTEKKEKPKAKKTKKSSRQQASEE